MGKKEYLEEINKQIKLHSRSMFGNLIVFFIGFCFLVYGIYLYIKIKPLENPLIFNIFGLIISASHFAIFFILLGIALMLFFIIVFFRHKQKYEKLKLEEAKEK